jgi:hypothetical protein
MDASNHLGFSLTSACQFKKPASKSKFPNPIVQKWKATSKHLEQVVAMVQMRFFAFLQSTS